MGSFCRNPQKIAFTRYIIDISRTQNVQILNEEITMKKSKLAALMAALVVSVVGGSSI